MAVKTSIQIQGSALSALGKMTTALNKVITRFERLQQVLSSNVNTQGLDRINRCLSQMQNNTTNRGRRGRSLSQTINGVQNSARDIRPNISGVEERIRQVNTSQNNIRPVLSNTSHVIDNIQQIQNNMNRVSNNITQMQGNIGRIVNDSGQIQNNMGRTANNMGRTRQETDRVRDGMGRTRQETDRVGDGMRRTRQETDRVGDGMRRTRQETEGFGDQVQRGNSAVSGLARSIKSMVGAYIGLRGLQQGMQAVDNFSNQRARLSMIVDDGGSVEEQEKKVKELENKIFSAAQRSKGNYSDMVSTVAKLGVTAKKAFRNNDELVKFSELMQKSYIVGGANASEVSNSMLQLTQAMASGRLQGEEYRSIIENAPMLANAIAEYTGVGMEGLKQLSSEGAISADIIKNALFSAGEDIEKKFEKMPVTFSSAWTDIKNTSIMKARDMMSRISSILNSDIGRNAIEGVRTGIHTIITVLGNGIEVAIRMISIIQSGWGVIGPILGIAVTWLMLYKGAMLASAAATGGATIAENLNLLALQKRLQISAAMQTALMGEVSAQTAAKLATVNETIAQKRLNKAFYACPLFWIIGAIVLLIAIIFLAVKAINKWKKTNISAVGIVAGIFSVFLTTVHNIFTGMWNTVAAFVNFFVNVFKDPVASVKILFLDMVTNVLGYVKTLAQGIEDAVNKIPGVEIHLTGGVENLIKELSDKSKDIKSKAEWEEVFKTKEYWQYSDKIKDAYQWGAGVEDKIADKLENIELDIPGFTDSPLLESMKETADNTGKIADSLEMDKDDLEYIRDMANSKYANKYIMPQIKLEMVNHNAIASDLDIDGIVDKMTQKVGEALAVSAEGAYI